MQKIFKYSASLSLTFCSIGFNAEAYAGDRTFNIRTAPVSDLIGIVNLEGDIAVSKRITLGPSYTGFNYKYKEIRFDSDAYGLRANYYLTRNVLEGGWIASLSGSYGRFKISKDINNVEYSASVSTRFYTALISYQAMWRHFNMTFGLGASYFSLPSTIVGVGGADVAEIDTSFASGVVPNAEFTLGWSF